jgi:thioredoxin 1
VKIINEPKSTEEFDDEIRNTKNIIIDVFAEWCQPCKELQGTLEELEKEIDGISVVSISLEHNDWMAERYEVDSIPRLLFFKDGSLKEQFRGAAPKMVIKAYVDNVYFDKPFFEDLLYETKEKFLEAMKQKPMILVLAYTSEDPELFMKYKNFQPFTIQIAEKENDVPFLMIDISKNVYLNEILKDIKPMTALFFKDGLLVGNDGIEHPDALALGILENLKGVSPVIRKDGMSEKEFEHLLSENVVIEIFRKESHTCQMLKPLFFRVARDTPTVKFYSIEYDMNPWIASRLGVSSEDYNEFGEEGRKVPYYLFVKQGNIVKESGPMYPEDMLVAVNCDILDIYKVTSYPDGIEQDVFNQLIKEHSKVIVDIYADWCGPCKFMKPIFMQLSAKFEDIIFISINSDNAPWIGTSDNYDFEGIPAFLFFKDGALVEKKIGGCPEEEFVELIRKAF